MDPTPGLRKSNHPVVEEVAAKFRPLSSLGIPEAAADLAPSVRRISKKGPALDIRQRVAQLHQRNMTLYRSVHLPPMPNTL